MLKHGAALGGRIAPEFGERPLQPRTAIDDEDSGLRRPRLIRSSSTTRQAEPVEMLSGSLARPDLVEAALKGDPDKAYSTAVSTLSLEKLLP
jgi:hypothetical protein